MVSLLPNLANNLVEGIHKIKCKYGLDNKKCGTFGTKYKDCEWCLGYTSLCCNDNYQKLFYYYEKVFTRMNTWMIEKKFDKT